MKKIFIAALFLVTGKSFAVTTVTLNMSTGWNQISTAPLSPGAPDPEWEIYLNGTGSPITPTVGYPPAYGSCASIQPGPYGNDVPMGYHIYRYKFVNNFCDLTSTAFIAFNYTNADDAIINVKINSTYTYDYLSNPPYIQPGIMTGFPTTPYPYSYGIYFPSSNIHAGVNYIDFLVYNDTADIYDSPNWLAIEATLVYYHNGTQYMNPSFTMPTSICQNTLPLTVNGTGTTGTINDHVWLVVESDASGNPVPSATEWWGPFMSGSPGVYTIPSAASGGPTMSCGKYYRVKLATQNACSSWAETTRVVYIACSPNADIGPDQYICESGCVTLSAQHPVNVSSYSWAEMHHFPVNIGNTQSVTVCPTQSTKYCLTETSVNGCSSTACIMVYVEHDNPDFTWTCNNSNTNYATFTATPIQTSNFPAGFQYAWIVEELNSSMSPVWTVTNPACWWNFPTTLNNTFNGMMGLTGTFSTSCAPSPGQFKYNTYYRVTRGVWSDHCPWQQVSYNLYCPGSNSMAQFVTGVTIAPDMSSLVMGENVSGMNEVGITTNKFNVYPNPTNGQLSIEYSLQQDGKINITDVTGKILTTMNALSTESRKNIDLSAYVDGIYFVHLYTGDQLFKTEKVVISH